MPMLALGTTRAAGGCATVSGPHADLLSFVLELPNGSADYDDCSRTQLLAHVGVAAHIASLAALAITRCLDAVDRHERNPEGLADAGALHAAVVSPISVRPCDVGPDDAQFILAFSSEYPALSTGDDYENHYVLYAYGVQALRALGAYFGALRGNRPRLVWSRRAA